GKGGASDNPPLGKGGQGGAFDAKLVTVGNVKVANGSDFDENTGQIIAGRRVLLLNEDQARALLERIQNKPWTVGNIEERPVTRKPSPPFTTSTLQQEANRKLRLGARETMRIAQSLYERGFITYMRTDSVHLSEQAIVAARSCVQELYGSEYLSPQPRKYTTKSKGAQEAHEAIRPAGSTFRTPQQTGLDGVDFRLYDLIWKRTVASQMADSRQTHVTVLTQVEDAGFRSSGKRIDFPGFLRAYVEGSDDPDAALEDQEVILPALKVGDKLNCKDLEAVGHETQPPARYTEASLVKMLESEGVGRPSTYASIIGTIVDRGYAKLIANALIPTFTAFAVTTLLETHFPDLVDTGFTSRMEQTLDEIATGEAQWLPYLDKFYRGETGLATQVKEQEDRIDPKVARTVVLKNLQAKVCIGKYGAYLESESEEGLVKASIPQDLTPADLDPEKVEFLLKQKTEGPEKLGLHPDTGEPIYVLVGNYGPYVQLGDVSETNKKPKRSSLPKGTDKDSVTVDMAVSLLTLPRLLGTHPETGAKVQANLGMYGPYVVHDQGKVGKDYRSIKPPDDVLTIELDRALELLSQPKAARGRGKSATPLKELGAHPESGEAINVYDGRYGPYVKHGDINASLAKDESVENFTLQKALDLLAAKEAAGGGKSSKSKKSSKTAAAKSETATEKKAAKKTTAKKTTAAKKTTTKKATTATATKKKTT
ncbi:type I DNA topoisomerase, partial [Tychonema sp. LEGE 07203]|uniref:type I DNA topoisomerase n=1 Tax=Tychonema sp. LEGE 07203 TaxID=1828671 RepID=UPI00187E4EF9